MCYAIPGKVLEVKGNIAILDYFGEQRKARNDFFSLNAGEYVYAQGGFIVQKISSSSALSILETWKELFFKLKEVDQELASQKTKTLYQKANNIRHKYHGNSCCVHAILEFSNYCQCDCLYCGIRKSNSRLTRYRMPPEEIIRAAGYAVQDLGFKALVLQSGEDTWYGQEQLLHIVKEIQAKSPCLLILSIGERDFEIYEKLYSAGARAVLLRFETSNSSLYAKMRPGRNLEKRLELINKLRDLGYLLMSGFLIGLLGSSDEDILQDIKLTGSLGVEMFSFGPFIPHPDTPLKDTPKPQMEMVLNSIARARIMYPEAKILVTTSLETLDEENALRLGLMAGANSLMVNVTPEKYRRFYEIYPSHSGINEKVEEQISSILKLLHSLGRAPTDLGLSR